MLPKKNRVTRKEFPSHKQQGIRAFSALFSCTIYPCRDVSKISVVVSKKIDKRAIARNTLRRRFYAIAETYIKDFSREALIVFYPKIEARKAPFSLLKTEMERVLRSAKLVN